MRVFFILVVFILHLFNLQAQEVIIFDDQEEQTEYASDPKNLINVWVFKTNPLSAIWGQQFFEVEKPVLSFLSLQGGLGATFYNYTTFNTGVYEELFDVSSNRCTSDNWDAKHDICDNTLERSFRETKLGYIGKTSARFYLDSYAPEEFYFSINFRYSLFNKKAQKADESKKDVVRLKDQFSKEYSRKFTYSVNFGYQYLFDPMVLETFIGLGFQNSTHVRQDLGRNKDGFVRHDLHRYVTKRPTLIVGIRLGYHTSTKKKNKNKKKSRRR